MHLVPIPLDRIQPMLESTQAETQATFPPRPFIDRRGVDEPSGPPGVERRQFASNYDELSAEARDLALAIDNYKLAHRRRFITHEELLFVFKQLGYRKG